MIFSEPVETTVTIIKPPEIHMEVEYDVSLRAYIIAAWYEDLEGREQGIKHILHDANIKRSGMDPRQHIAIACGDLVQRLVELDQIGPYDE